MKRLGRSRARAGGHGLVRIYLTSIVTIAILTISEQAMMAATKAEHDADGRYLSVLDRQMTVSQRLVSTATTLIMKPNQDQIESARERLTRDLSEFERLEAGLSNGSQSLGLPLEYDQEIRHIYRNIRQDYWGIRRSAETILGGSGNASDLSALFDSQGRHQDGLSLVESSYRSRTDARFRLLQSVEPALAMLILAVLMFEFLFIFKPEILAMQKSAKDLLELNVELTESLDEVSAQREELTTQKQLLQEHETELRLKNLRLTDQQNELEDLNRSLDQSHEVYADAARRMEALFQGIPAACFSFDRDGKITDWNHAAEALFGYNSYDVLDHLMDELLSNAMGAEAVARLSAVLVNGMTVEDLIWKSTDDSGAVRWAVTSAFPVFDGKGDATSAICSCTDITDRIIFQAELEETMVQINEFSLELEVQKQQLVEANAKLEALATTDGLTGLRNHRSFQERLEADVQRAIEDEVKLSLLLLDVDKFKVFNDTFGHPEGDKVLIAVGAVLAEYSAEPITAARYGGEEFVIVLPATGELQALQVAEEVRSKIEASNPTGVTVTASIGVASWSHGMRSRAQIIAQADKALYRAKADGRNRVVHASSMWSDDAGAFAA